MSLTEKVLDVATGQIMKNPLAQEVMKVTETLGIKNITTEKLTQEETKVQLDLFKKNFEGIAKLAKLDGDITKSVDEAVDNKSGFFSELAFQWFEKGNYKDNVQKVINALKDLQDSEKLPKDLDLIGLEKDLLAVAPSTQQIALGAIPLIGSWFTANGSAFKSLNETFDLINKELQPKASEENSSITGAENEEFSEGEVRVVGNDEILESSIEVSEETKHFVDFVETYDGMKYKYGGNGKTNIDCSLLIKNSLKEGGIDFPRTAADQMNEKRLVSSSIEEAKLGDFIYFEKDGKITHTGLVKYRLKNGDLVIYDASTNEGEVTTRVIKPTSKKFKYYIKDTSKLLEGLKTEDMTYNEHTGESIDGEIQTA